MRPPDETDVRTGFLVSVDNVRFVIPLIMRRKNRKPEPPGAAHMPNPSTPIDAVGEHWRWCPRCGHELINEKCKLHCPRCHYFMSCSDFDFAG